MISYSKKLLYIVTWFTIYSNFQKVWFLCNTWEMSFFLWPKTSVNIVCLAQGSTWHSVGRFVKQCCILPESWHFTSEFLFLAWCLASYSTCEVVLHYAWVLAYYLWVFLRARDLASYTCEVVLHDLSLGMLLVSSCCLPEACHVTCGNVLWQLCVASLEA